ncbi:hypothetical protein RDABS01_035762, partial [Bienertia sinuspersici]
MASSSESRSRINDEEDRVQELQFCCLKGDTRIAELAILIEELGNEVRNLKQVNWKLEDDVTEMAIGNTEQLAMISSATADKKLYNLWLLHGLCLLLCCCSSGGRVGKK